MARDIAVIDCETDPFLAGRVPEPFLWCFFDGREYITAEHDHIEPFLAQITDKPRIIYAHNGGRFDFIFLKHFIKAGQEVMIINGRLARFKIGRAEFRDSWNIIPAPLAAYKKSEFDYRLMEREHRYKTDNWRAITAYLKSDCRYLHELVTAFKNRHGIKLTQAGASMHAYEQLTLERIEDSGPEFFEQFKPYYFGGRVECFKGGVIERPFKVLDINSAYPHAMMHPHPRGLEYERAAGLLDHADAIRMRARSTGAFPLKDAKSGRLDFPADGQLREFCVTGWEFQAARETDTLPRGFRVLESYRFKRRDSFAPYIEQLWQERLEAKAINDKAGSLLAKLAMNSLYGKFAADPSRYRTFRVMDTAPEDSGEPEDFATVARFGDRYLVAQPLHPLRRRYYNVMTAASITGFVRAMLWRAICSCGRRTMLYCDTDSLATARVRGLALGDRLGQWKDEGDFKRAAIAGKKLYAFERVKPVDGERFKIASKGVQLTARQIFSVARGRTVVYSPQVPTLTPLHEARFTKRKIRNTIR